jgi:hypothetical protein
VLANSSRCHVLLLVLQQCSKAGVPLNVLQLLADAHVQLSGGQKASTVPGSVM